MDLVAVEGVWRQLAGIVVHMTMLVVALELEAVQEPEAG